MAELLLELFSEEIPARMQRRAAADLKRLVCDALAAKGLAFAGARAFATPRRLALVVDGVPPRQADVAEEKRGPRVGAPAQAVNGFLAANGLAGADQLEQRDTGKGVFYFHRQVIPGKDTARVVPEILGEVLAGLPWPKSMRWADGELRWVRPLRAILCLFDGQPVIFEQPLAGGGRLAAGDWTFGHRFHGPGRIRVSSFADYEGKLRAARVMLDPEERKREIWRQAERLAGVEGLWVKRDEGLLEEVAGLVEWPVVHVGRIDDAFMDLPPEVMTTSMRSHQKYFATLRADDTLAPRFVVVANTETEDGGKVVVAGNERVLRARLSDARFFWDQDRRIRLADRLPALAKITFHAKLGTLADKVARVEALAASLAARIPGCDADLARRAARLAKCDLVTGMVGEFPELQGVMGRYYALHDGEDAAVAGAIADHYAPASAADRVPTAPVSVAVALADKLDTLTGFWSIDEKPTGSKDPFALRRAALGVIRIVLENRIRLPLQAVTSSGDLLGFFIERLKVYLRDHGIRHDIVAAVIGGDDDLLRIVAKAEALRGFLDGEAGANLLTAYRRAANILRIEEKKDGTRHAAAPDPAAFVQGEETALHAALAAVNAAAAPLLAAEDYAGAMAALAGLRAPVDAFFENVTVNTQDAALRVNRLKLMSRIVAAMDAVADFSVIEG